MKILILSIVFVVTATLLDYVLEVLAVAVFTPHIDGFQDPRSYSQALTRFPITSPVEELVKICGALATIKIGRLDFRYVVVLFALFGLAEAILRFMLNQNEGWSNLLMSVVLFLTAGAHAGLGVLFAIVYSAGETKRVAAATILCCALHVVCNVIFSQAPASEIWKYSSDVFVISGIAGWMIFALFLYSGSTKINVGRET
jgi:hypothetical protein